jgi:hypothetical protein
MEIVSSFKILVKSYKASQPGRSQSRFSLPQEKTQILHNIKCLILILGEGEEGSKGRALHLLSLLKEARHLTKQKNVWHTNEVAFHSQTLGLSVVPQFEFRSCLVLSPCFSICVIISVLKY